MKEIDLTCIRLARHSLSLGYYCIDDFDELVNVYTLTNKGLDRSLDKIMVKYNDRTIQIEKNNINDIVIGLAELGYSHAKQYIRQQKIDGLLS